MKNVIVFAEKSKTHGTHVAFRHLFGIEFQPDQDVFTTRIDNVHVNVVYMSVEEMKYNNEYAEKCKRWARELIVTGVICFEYCSPRVQEIAGNIRKLRTLFDLERIRFVFCPDESSGDSNVKQKKAALVKQIRAFEGCHDLKNLERNVYLLDEPLKLTSIINISTPKPISPPPIPPESNIVIIEEKAQRVTPSRREWAFMSYLNSFFSKIIDFLHKLNLM